jgi:dTDP-4-dehydrorhamnose 3,5-epimerase
MRFIETGLVGAWVIEAERLEDERGFFARTFSADEFAAHGLETCLAQCNISFNKHQGTLRGLHFQAAPNEEARLVRCTMGTIYDVMLDLRPDSKTLNQWFSYELSALNRAMVYIPKGFAHGFQTLTDECEVFYQMSEFYHPEKAQGVRWNDPAFGIIWPLRVTTISAKDAGYPDW